MVSLTTSSSLTSKFCVFHRLVQDEMLPVTYTLSLCLSQYDQRSNDEIAVNKVISVKSTFFSSQSEYFLILWSKCKLKGDILPLGAIESAVAGKTSVTKQGEPVILWQPELEGGSLTPERYRNPVVLRLTPPLSHLSFSQPRCVFSNIHDYAAVVILEYLNGSPRQRETIVLWNSLVLSRMLK